MKFAFCLLSLKIGNYASEYLPGDVRLIISLIECVDFIISFHRVERCYELGRVVMSEHFSLVILVVELIELSRNALDQLLTFKDANFLREFS